MKTMNATTFYHPGVIRVVLLAACACVAAEISPAQTPLAKDLRPPPPATAGQAVSPVPRFEAGDRWCAIGDSITHTGLYTRYIYLFHTIRFPETPIDFINGGSAGDTAKGTVARLSKDILRHRPTVATIMLGMNDVRRNMYLPTFNAPDAQAQRDAAIDTYVASMRKLAEELKAARVRMIFITPSIFDDTAGKPGEKRSTVNAALGRCAEITRKLAAEFHSPLVDLHGPMSRLNLELQKTDPLSSIIGPDRIHPKEPGGFIMAYLFLKAQGTSPFVDKIEKDAAGKAEISFEHTAKSLPFPVPPECAPALAIVPFTEELNREILRVTGLAAGNYQLLIDGSPISSFTSNELATGVNLATLSNTPQARQSREVLALDDRRYELERGLRTIDFYERGLNPHFGTDEPFDYLAALAKRPAPKDAWAKKNRETYLAYKPRVQEVRKEKEELVIRIRETCRPRPHRFTLRRE